VTSYDMSPFLTAKPLSISSIPIAASTHLQSFKQSTSSTQTQNMTATHAV
jgi:hypothetical protein